MAAFDLPPDLRALIARIKARKSRPVQRAEYRAALLERAAANYRKAGAIDLQARRRMEPPDPPAGVS